MANIVLLGFGAIGQYVANHIMQSKLHHLQAVITRKGGESSASSVREKWGLQVSVVNEVAQVQQQPDLFVDCAGHEGFRQHVPAMLMRGVDVITVSVGVLADKELHDQISGLVRQNNVRLLLASGAVGALDALQGAAIGGLTEVTYCGIKPPRGWRGSPAERSLDLEHLTERTIHFDGCARLAASRYPKNANVAAAIALAGLGFEDTRVRLIADPKIQHNIHNIEAVGEFGRLNFKIEGKSLPDNPKSSALTAMSVIKVIEDSSAGIRFR